MLKRICTLALLGALSVSMAGCDKCGDWLKPHGPFGVCKSDNPQR